MILDIHNARPHEGQILVAERFRSLLHSDTFPSEIAGIDKRHQTIGVVLN